MNIYCGVPQGSVLGPLLFIIYMNDLVNVLNYCKCILFADDTTLYHASKNINNCKKQLESDLTIVNNWFKANYLSLNNSKTYFMHYNKKSCDRNVLLRFGNLPVSECTNIKFLGVYIDNKLKWDKDTNYIHSKLVKTVYILNRLKYLLPSYIMRTIYYSIFDSYVNYGIILWGNANDCLMKPLYILQKKALRAICKVNYNADTVELFKTQKILKISEMYLHSLGKLNYRFSNKLLPSAINNVFTQNYDIHNHFTRNRAAPHMFIKKSSVYCNSFLFKSPKLWHVLPRELKAVNNLGLFNRKLKLYILNNPDINISNIF